MRFAKALAAVTLVSLAITPLAAKPVKLSKQNLHDARCAMVAAMTESDETDGKADTGMIASIVYFFGKLRASLPNTPFDEIFTDALVYDVAANRETYRQGCADELLQVAPEMTALGEKISAMPNQPPSH